MEQIYIGIGSNLDNPLHQVKTAIKSISGVANTAIQKTSSFYRSSPLGPANQPDFINVVIMLDTTLPPLQLLHCLQQIEQAQGRVRKVMRWGPRIIDLDILLYGQRVITDDKLTIPHYGLKDRPFFIYPLAEIQPDLVLPNGENMVELQQRCHRGDLTLIEDGP